MDTTSVRVGSTSLSRSLFSVFGTVLALLLFATSAFAQEGQEVLDNKIQIKLTESAKTQFVGEDGALPESVSGNAVQQTGVSVLDQFAQQYNVSQMERVFRKAGKHEPRHVEWGLDRWYIVNYDADAGPRSVAEAYASASAQVESAAPVYKKELVSMKGNSEAGQPPADEEPTLIPNDPEYSSQWHYNNTSSNVGTPDADVDLPEAHDITTGNSDVIVSITDTGLDLDHPDLQPMLWTNQDEVPGNGADDDNNGFVDDVHGYDHVNGDGEPEAGSDIHGSHVGGTVGAKNDNGQFGAGVAGGDGTSGSGVRLMANKVFEGFGGGGFAEAITYAADNGAHISQNSWGGGGPDTAIEDAIEYFTANAGGPNEPIDGGVAVFAAGNSNTDMPFYPAFYEETLAVGASNENDGRSGYSNFGSWVDIAAPGGGGPAVGGCGATDDDVWSTVPDGFSNLCGTSMATPHASGVAALVASASPGISDEIVDSTLVNNGDQISTDQPIGPRLNAFNAVQAVGDDSQPPAAIADLATTGVAGNEVDLEWTAPGDDGDTGTATSYDLRWSESPIDTEEDFTNANQVQGEPQPEPAGTVQTFTVGGLPFSTEIYFAIRASDEVGNTGDLSNSPSATTGPAAQIAVDPGSFSVSLETGESTNRTLTISNVGDPGAGPLNFTATVGSGTQTSPNEVAAPASGGSGNGSSFEIATGEADGDPTGPDPGPTATTYQLDDGTSEDALGLTDGGDFMWLNAFQVVEGAGTLTEISSAFGWSGGSGIPEGKTVTYVVYNDPNNDGDPSDAELLTQTQTEIQSPHTDQFTTASIEPTLVEGTFFIAVLYEGQAAGTFPGPMDESSEYQGSSWVVGDTGGEFNLDDLTANDVPPSELGSIGFPANWLLRAEGGSSFLAIEPTEGSVEQGGSQDLTATFDASGGLEPGTYEASINIQSNDPDDPTMSVASTLEVTAGPPEITAEPDPLAFGGVLKGDMKQKTITLTNTGGTDLEVTEITLTNDNYSLADPNDQGGFMIPFGESHEVEVKFAPSATGSMSGSFLANTAQGVSALVSLEGQGLPAPTLAFTPDTLEKTVTVGDSADVPLTLSNEGMSGSTLEYSFPTFAAMDLINDPDVPENNTSSVIDDPSYERTESGNGGDPHAGIGHPIVTGAGGPDGFGNTWIDSNEPGGPTFQWMDISDVGTALEITDDFGSTPSPEVELPFPFEFYGEEKTSVRVDNNGFLHFDSPSGAYFGNDEIPTSDDPNGVVAAFWDDLDPGAGGTVYTYHDEANDRFIVQYDEVPGFFTGGPYTFQIILNEDGTIRYQYLDMNDPLDSATTGIENANGDDGLQIAFNPEGGYVENELAVLIGTGRKFIADVEPASGAIEDGESEEVSVTFSAEGIEPGEFEPLGDFLLTTNDPSNPSTPIPARMTVETGEPSLTLDPSTIDHGAILTGTSNTRTFTIVNDGAAPLEDVEVSSTNEDFTLVNDGDAGPFDIPLFGSRDIEVKFAPEQVSDDVGEITGQIEVTSNAPTASVTAMGEGIPAPTLAFSPDTLEKELNPGDSGEETLTVTNDGMSGSSMEFSFPGFAAMDLMNDPDVPENNTSSVIDDPSYERSETEDGGDPHAGIGHPVVTGAGGPDGFGYTWIDSNEPGGPSFQFTDISDVGTEVTISDDFGPNPSPEVDLPFSFEFYGEEKTSVRIDNNGFIHFDSPSGNYFGNDEIPTADDPNGVIAAYWDDLDPGAGGTVYTYHDEANDRFIIQWEEVEFFFGPAGATNTFQIVLDEDGAIGINYENVSGDSFEFPGESATTGIENAAGDTGLQITFNPEEQYHEDNLSISIQPPVNFITDVEPTSGTVDAGQSQDVSVTFDAAEITPGQFEQVPPVLLTSNDPNTAETTVPAVLNVISGPPTIALSPDSMGYGTRLVGGDSTRTLTVENTGDGPLNVSSVTTTSGQFTIVNDDDKGPFTVPLFESRDVEVKFAPSSTGTKTAQVVVNSDANNSPVASVPLGGEADPAPDIAVTPSSLTEQLRLGASSTQTLTVENSGNAALDFNATVGSAPTTTPSEVAVPAPSDASGGDNVEAETATEPYDGETTDVGPTATTYQIDDGTTENALRTLEADAMWLNAFQVVEGAGRITEISSAFGWSDSDGVPEGKTVTYALYEDPNDDGDPSDAELLTTTETEVQDPHTDTFVPASIEPTQVSGTFFVAVLYPDQASSGVFPAPMDESSTYQQASWWAAHDVANGFNLEDLTANAVPPTPVDEVGPGFPNNWLLRAEGSSTEVIAVSPNSGTIDQGETQDLTVSFNAPDAADTFERAINFSSNDPDDSPSVDVTFEAFDACPTSWELAIETSDDGGATESLLIGQSPFATPGLDNEFVGKPDEIGDADCDEVERPPIPPLPNSDFRFVDTGLPDAELGQGTSIDIRPDTGSTGTPNPESVSSAPAHWRIDVQSNSYPVSMSWDNDGLANALPNQPVRLVDAATGGNRVDVDMKATGSASISNTAVSAVEIRLGGGTHEMTMADGWNLNSMPVLLPDMTFSNVMTPCESGLKFNPGGTFENFMGNDEMALGEGYFMYCDAATLSITGTSVGDAHREAEVEDGWNIVGVFDEEIDASSVTASSGVTIESSFYGFDQTNGYTVAETLTPTNAYWVRISGSGTLDLTGGNSGTSTTASVAGKAATSSTENESPVGTRFKVTDSQGNSATLQVGKTLSKAQMKTHALPPSPPRGIFDVRFENGRSAVSVNTDGNALTKQGLHALKMQGVSYPVTISLVKPSEDASGLRIKKGRGADASELSLTADNPSVTLSEASTVEIGLRTVPDEFALQKSFPNPMRQQSTIKYAVPKQTKVTIEVYDVLGRKVAQLADGQKKAGVHSVQFDASQLSSGTYFYRMRAGDFSKTRRLTVLR